MCKDEKSEETDINLSERIELLHKLIPLFTKSEPSKQEIKKIQSIKKVLEGREVIEDMY